MSIFFEVVFLSSHVLFVFLFIHSYVPCITCIACIHFINFYLHYLIYRKYKKNIYHSLTHWPSDNLKSKDASASKNQLITSISDPTDVKKGAMWACRLVSFPIMNEYLIGKKHECDFNEKNMIVILLKIGGPSTCLQFSLGLSSWLSVM